MLGVIGAVTCLGIFINDPSFPTPDKLIIFLFFVFMIYGKALEGLRRFSPFIILVIIYESFRGIADELNDHVNYSLAPHIDKFLFGNLPTAYLQHHLWHGHIQWYDVALYLPYTLHFVIPLGLGILIWKTRDKYFWQVMNSFLVVAFACFLTFLIFPAAPPWMASNNHFIEPITRISSHVWAVLGLHNFPSIYNKITPNLVAAVPSQHAAWAALFFIFIYKLYGKKWGLLAGLYPLTIFFGTVYEGEHYVFDIALGILYAIAGYFITPYIMVWGRKLFMPFITKQVDLWPARKKRFTAKIWHN